MRPRSGNGLPTSRRPTLALLTDKLIVLDIDPRHDGDSSLAELERDHEFPSTWRVLTGGGGEHIIF